MRLPDGLTEAEFLLRYWQKDVLNMPGAIVEPEPAMSPDELAWLAMQPDVESRLVFTERDVRGDLYRVEHGSFTAETLENLPDRDWTLLVQDVEKHLPAFRALFAQVPFIPDWRIDDLMISVAAPGGSVGPHQDNYDVFLCQGSGTRHWRLTDSQAVAVDSSSHELSLLKPFEPGTDIEAANGDVLYLPPGVPHWGVARTLCVTYSIGMRAPGLNELLLACERLFSEGEDDTTESDRDAPLFLTDAGLDEAESEPGRISNRYVSRLRDQALLPDSLDDDQMAIVLGVVATDPKAWLAPDRVDPDEARKLMAGAGAKSQAAVHGMARIAWYAGPKNCYFFANGFHREVSDKQYQVVRQICGQRAVAIGQLVADTAMRELAGWMIEHGVFDGGENWT